MEFQAWRHSLKLDRDVSGKSVFKRFSIGLIKQAWQEKDFKSFFKLSNRPIIKALIRDNKIRREEEK